MILHTTQCTFCRCPSIPLVSTVKYLGIKFDSELSWNTHLAELCKRLRGVSCCLHNIKFLLPFSVRKLMVHSLAYSILRYGITLFAHCSGFWESKVDAILKGILKSVCYNVECESEDDLFRFLGMPSFHELFVRTVVLRHFWTDEYRVSRVLQYSLKSISRFETPRCRTRYGKALRCFYVPDVFNNLPESVFQMKSISHLKKALKSM